TSGVRHPFGPAALPFELARHVAREHVDFNVYVRTRPRIAEQRPADGVRDEHDIEGDPVPVRAAVPDPVDGEADAVDADGSFGGKVAPELSRHLDLEADRVAASLARGDRADAIDMAEDDVPPHAPAERRSTLEVDAGAERESAQR